MQLQHQDRAAATNFYNLISSGKHLTENQASYILKILEKHKNISSSKGFDYKIYIAEPRWKNPFRTIDLTRKIFVEKDDTGKIWLCLKFPYQLKTAFETEVTGLSDGAYMGVWDSIRGVRKLSLYSNNIILIHEFAKKYNLEIIPVVTPNKSQSITINDEAYLEDGYIINSDFLNNLSVEDAKEILGDNRKDP